MQHQMQGDCKTKKDIGFSAETSFFFFLFSSSCSIIVNLESRNDTYSHQIRKMMLLFKILPSREQNCKPYIDKPNKITVLLPEVIQLVFFLPMIINILDIDIDIDHIYIVLLDTDDTSSQITDCEAVQFFIKQ